MPSCVSLGSFKEQQLFATSDHDRGEGASLKFLKDSVIKEHSNETSSRAIEIFIMIIIIMTIHKWKVHGNDNEFSPERCAT